MLNLFYNTFFVKLCSTIVFCFSLVFAALPLGLLRWIAKVAGYIGYCLHKRRRKIALLNLQMIYPDYSSATRKTIAKQSFQNLAIVCFETCVLLTQKERFLKHIIYHHEKELVARLQKNEGVIFLGGHQANWEIYSLSPGVRGTIVAKPFKRSKWLYQHLLSYRQRPGKKIILPKKAIHESLKALKKGESTTFFDQAFHSSSKYSYPLFGFKASTSSAPALLAYKTKNPIVVVTNKRTRQGYEMTFSPMLFPNFENSFKEEVPKLMDRAMRILEESIAQRPGEWMWMHNRWRLKKSQFSASRQVVSGMHSYHFPKINS